MSKCIFCHERNNVETKTDRLHGCCKECAELDNNTEVVKKELPCVICGTGVRDVYFEKDITYKNVNFLSFDDGMANTIEYGFGCELDGRAYMIAICKVCTYKKVAEGKLTYVHNYIHPNN